MALRDDEIADILDVLEHHAGDKLSTWEIDFLTSIREQWEMRRSLTDKQRAKLG